MVIGVRSGRANAVTVAVDVWGCGDACPFYPGTRYLDWRLDDPAGLGVDAVRLIRDESTGVPRSWSPSC